MSAYFDELVRAMTMLAAHPRSVFMGQAVAYEGTAMFRTLDGVPQNKRVELPVAEDMQMGMATGAALAGMLPITIYPRFNFLLLATNQLVLHLDKMQAMAGVSPTVIIRTAVASRAPMDPGPQHLGDFSAALSVMLESTPVEMLVTPDDIVPAYTRAAARRGATLLVEYMCLY